MRQQLFSAFLASFAILDPVRSETIRRIEYIAGIILSLVGLVLLGIRATHAGPLWRDECDSVATATLPNFSELLRYFQFDSFPLPFALALRGYIAVVGNSDASLRVFGALVGISLLLVGWWSARGLRAGAPLVFLTLAALNPTFLTWGTTVRGYGIGSVMIVFAFAATANFLAHRTTPNAFLMGLAFVAAVQCLVINTALVFAICLGAIVVCFLGGDRKTACVIAGALGVTALSFVPYVATYFKMGWHVLLQTNVTFTALWETFRDSLSARNSATALAWLALTLIAAIPWIMRLTKGTVSSLSTFAVLAALLSLAGGCFFFKLLRYPPHQWYFLPFICLLASALELASSSFAASAAIRTVKLLVCVVAVTAMWWSNWPTLIARQSNIGLIANYLNSQAKSDDLIVVNPWFFGVSFNRYYRGVASWVTLPVLSEWRIHRYDLVQARMSEDDPLKDLRPIIERTLRNGGRIYLVGGAHWLGKDDRPLVLPAAPRSEYGWSYVPYFVAWSQQIAEFLKAHVQTGAELPQLAEQINPEEDVPLWQVEGWHD
jgi:hypothetical protein